MQYSNYRHICALLALCSAPVFAQQSPVEHTPIEQADNSTTHGIIGTGLVSTISALSARQAGASAQFIAPAAILPVSLPH